MGSLFGGMMQENNPDIDLTMFGSWQDQIEQINQNGLKIEQLDASENTHRIKATSNADEIKNTDIAIVLNKSWQTRKAAVIIKNILAPHGFVVTLQNGLRNREILESEVGVKKVITGLTSEAAFIKSPGCIKHAGVGATYLEKSILYDDEINFLADCFGKAGFNPKLIEDIAPRVWMKLAVNAGINPLTALLEVRNGELHENQFAKNVLIAAGLEVKNIAIARDIELPISNIPKLMERACFKSRSNFSSMYQDVLRGAKTEIESISGAVVAHGKTMGVDTPVNSFLYENVKAKEQGTAFDLVKLVELNNSESLSLPG
jgi:2-dehydropantoate 2-reductase